MIVVDVETTGLDPARHSIVSIGAVEFLSRDPVRHIYLECQPWYGAEISDEALAVNGFTREQLQAPDRWPHQYAIHDFHDWAMECQSRVLAGQHIVFDFAFLKASYEEANRHEIWPFGRRTVDLHAVAYCHFLADLEQDIPLHVDGTSALGLDTILSRLGMPPEPKPHNALNGARLAAEAFRRLIYGEAQGND